MSNFFLHFLIGGFACILVGSVGGVVTLAVQSKKDKELQEKRLLEQANTKKQEAKDKEHRKKIDESIDLLRQNYVRFATNLKGITPQHAGKGGLFYEVWDALDLLLDDYLKLKGRVEELEKKQK